MEIRELIDILKKGRWIIGGIFVLTLVFTILVYFLKAPVYEASVLMRVDKDPLAEILSEIADKKKPTDIEKEKQAATKEFVDFLISEVYQEEFFSTFSQKNNKKVGPKLDGTTFFARTVEKDYNLIFLSFQANNPLLSREVAKFFVDNIKTDYSTKKMREKKLAMEVLDEQIRIVIERINKLEAFIPARIKKFKYIDLYTYIKDQEYVLTNLKVDRSKNIDDIENNPIIIKLRNRISELKAALRKTKTEAHKKELTAILQDSLQKLRTTEMLLRGKKNMTASYAMELNRLDGELNYLKKYDKDILIKINGLKVEQDKLNKLIEYKNQLQMAYLYKNLLIQDIKGPMFDPLPINKQPARIFGLAMVLGLLMGITIVLFNNYLEPEKIKIEDLSGEDCNFWGEVSLTPKGFLKKNKLILSEKKEEYSLLRTKMLFDIKGNHKVFAVLDLGGENYKEIIPRLAVSLENIGKKVLMIDADFRSGFFAEKDKEQPQGLKDLLTGAVDSLLTEALYIKSEEYSSVSLLPSGGPVEAPADLLSLPLFGQLLKKFKKDFELVFVLVPGNLNVADSLVVFQQADNICVLVDLLNETGHNFKKAMLGVKKYFKNNINIIGYQLL